jgi:transposase
LRWLVRTGAQWRMLPHDLRRWEAVYHQTQRWLRAGCFEAVPHDLQLLLRLAAGCKGQPSAVILDARYRAIDARERHPPGFRLPPAGP